MHDALGPGTMLGYCTNVHAGVTLEQTRANLQQHALAVKAIVSPHAPMGIGLWLSAEAARGLVEPDRLAALRDWLDERGLAVFTINGFPYADFHQPVVKHGVYRPDWCTDEREQYTIDLVRILAGLLPGGHEGSISTLPIGWPDARPEADRLDEAGARLQRVAQSAHEIGQQRGRVIHLDIEPEPGCLLQRSADLVRFFKGHLLRDGDEEITRRHVRVCHDVCHAAVMFEDQQEMFDHYDAAGIRVGKVQVSNAIRADLRGCAARERVDRLAELRAFAEDRYLHQTMVQSDSQLAFFDDLPEALATYAQTNRAGDEWRVHFHVPVFLESIGSLGTTRGMIKECVELLRGRDVRHWEVETYAWNVLPEAMHELSLAAGIARELQWVASLAPAEQAN